MAISGGYKRGQNLAQTERRAEVSSESAKLNTDRAKLRSLKKKNQRRGVALIVLMGLLIILFLIGAWYLDGVLGEDHDDPMLSSSQSITCDFGAVRVSNWDNFTERARRTVCEVIENIDILEDNRMNLVEITMPVGFAHALDLRFTESRGSFYRILVDSSAVLQLAALIDAEYILTEHNLRPNVVDLRVEGRAYIN
jgi:hypothetical protein